MCSCLHASHHPRAQQIVIFFYTMPIRYTYRGYSIMHYDCGPYDCACPSSVWVRLIESSTTIQSTELEHSSVHGQTRACNATSCAQCTWGTLESSSYRKFSYEKQAFCSFLASPSPTPWCSCNMSQSTFQQIHVMYIPCILYTSSETHNIIG